MENKNSQMSLEIQESIQKNLPAQVAGELKTYLERAQKNETELERVSKNYLELQKIYEEQKKSLQAYTAEVTEMNKFAEKLEKLEKILAEREFKLDMTVLKVKLEESEKRSQEAVNIVGLVFKSPVYRRNIQENLYNQQIYDNNGQQQNVPCGSSKMETAEEE